MSESNPITERRYGIFCIGREELLACPDLVRAVMGRCIILRCENVFYTDQMKYLAACADFQPLGHGEELPCYSWQMGDGGLECVWGRLGHGIGYGVV